MGQPRWGWMGRWRGVARRLARSARGGRRWVIGLLLVAIVASGLLSLNAPRLSRLADSLTAGSATPTPTATTSPTPTMPPTATPTPAPDAPVALTQYVNPFIGSEWASHSFGFGGSGGQTFPGATVPFGMVQWSPDTGPTPSWALDPGGYTYSDSRIERFSLTHINGAGCNVAGDIPFMPTTAALDVPPPWSGERYSATFTHAHEAAEPGYYRVQLNTGIQVELTATPRSGLARLRYPAGQRQTLLIETGTDLQQVYNAHAEVVSPTEVVGWVTGGHFCNVLPSTYTVYFAARFSRPAQAFSAWQGGVMPGARQASGPQSGLALEFPSASSTELLVKVGLSYVGVANARANLAAENPSWDFDAVRAGAHATWNTLLNRMRVSGGSATDLHIFYTALYHALLQPNTFSDANGQYLGFDGQVHTASGYTHYANFSGWDIYRTQIPLIALLTPKQAGDIMQSLVVDAEQGGGLPRWSLANVETGLMVGDPAAAILAEGLAFGADGFDTGAALRVLVRGATQPGIGPPGSLERPGLDLYQSLGYVPLGAASAPTAASLEYYTADYAIACFAARQGDAATARAFAARAANWSRLFNPATGTIQPRAYDGSFVGDGATTDGFIEGTAGQYTWMVPFDLGGLATRMGGHAQAAGRLDAFFTEINAGPREPYAWMGNEVSFGAPWVYDYLGVPWKTQTTVRRIMGELFKNTPDGLPGNDDLGTMSSWYVWAALGLYPLIPGRAGFALGSPLFPEVTLTLGFRHLRLVAKDAGQKAPYVRDMRIDGVPYSRQWLPLAALTKASEVTYTMASGPNRSWGSAPGDAPPSLSAEDWLPAPPVAD